MSNDLKERAIAWVEENSGFLVDAHMKYWEWAEVGLQELKTGMHMADVLEENVPGLADGEHRGRPRGPLPLIDHPNQVVGTRCNDEFRPRQTGIPEPKMVDAR